MLWEQEQEGQHDYCDIVADIHVQVMLKLIHSGDDVDSCHRNDVADLTDVDDVAVDFVAVAFDADGEHETVSYSYH